MHFTMWNCSFCVLTSVEVVRLRWSRRLLYLLINPCPMIWLRGLLSVQQIHHRSRSSLYTQILARSQTLRESSMCLLNISMKLTRSIRHGDVTFAVVGTNIPGALQTITVEPNIDVNKTIGSKQLPFCDPCIYELTLLDVQFSETFQLDHSISTNQSHLTQSILIIYWM